MTDAPERIWIDPLESPMYFIFSLYEGQLEYVRIDIASEKDAKIAELEQHLATAKERALKAERKIKTGWIKDVQAARKSGFEKMRQAAIEIVEFELPHEVDSALKNTIVAQLKYVAMKSQDDLRNEAIAEPVKLNRWRHKKRGTTYTEIGRGKLQTSRDLVDCDPMVIYKGDDGQFWVRPESEFDDGRFEPIESEANK